MVSTSTVAEIGALLGDPARISMMIALLDGRSRTASELADVAGVSPPTASGHLAKLAAANMIQVERQGRHRYHRIGGPAVAQLLEQMHVAGAALSAARTARFGPRDPAMRELRSCYDHLAGRIAVELGGRLLAKDAAVGVAELDPSAGQALERMGIDVTALSRGKRAPCRACLDWSERRPHLAGAVGAAILRRSRELGWIKARSDCRALILTVAGERGLADVFGIHSVRS